MRLLFDEYGDTIFQAVVSIIIYSIFISFFLTKLLGMNVSYIKEEVNIPELSGVTSKVKVNEFRVKDGLIKVNEKFNYEDRAYASNSLNEDISSYITLDDYANIDTSKPGEKDVTYILRYNGQTLAKKAKLIIVDEKEVESA